MEGYFLCERGMFCFEMLSTISTMELGKNTSDIFCFSTDFLEIQAVGIALL
jgi:hypothetical protein